MENDKPSWFELFRVKSTYVPSESSFPYFEMTILFFASLTSAIPLTGLFPYVANMTVDLGMADSVDDAGYASGYLASAFMLGRLLTSFHWGYISDITGRKPVTLFACISIVILSLAFGFSVNFWMALFTRFLLGLLNPLNSTTKTLISELCAKKYQPTGMSLASGSWSVGLIVGPFFGGLLARPALLYPSTFDTWFWRKFPYLLPNLVTAVMALISFVLVWFYLPETLRVDEVSGPNKKVSFVNSARDLLIDRKVLLVFIGYVAISLISIVFDEVLPLWALSSPEKGGLGYSIQQVGNVASIAGVPVLIHTFLIYPLLGKKFKQSTLFRYGQLLCGLFAYLTMAIPYYSNMSENGVFAWYIVSATLCKCSATSAFTSIFLLVNGSVSHEKLGAVNGMSLTFGGFAKAIGPFAGSTIFAWSIHNSISDKVVNCTFVFLLCLLIGIVTCFLDLSPSNHQYEDYSSPQKGTRSDIELGTFNPIHTIEKEHTHHIEGEMLIEIEDNNRYSAVTAHDDEDDYHNIAPSSLNKQVGRGDIGQ